MDLHTCFRKTMRCIPALSFLMLAAITGCGNSYTTHSKQQYGPFTVIIETTTTQRLEHTANDSYHRLSIRYLDKEIVSSTFGEQPVRELSWQQVLAVWPADSQHVLVKVGAGFSSEAALFLLGVKDSALYCRKLCDFPNQQIPFLLKGNWLTHSYHDSKANEFATIIINIRDEAAPARYVSGWCVPLDVSPDGRMMALAGSFMDDESAKLHIVSLHDSIQYTVPARAPLKVDVNSAANPEQFADYTQPLKAVFDKYFTWQQQGKAYSASPR